MSNPSGTVIESQADWLTVAAHGRDAARNLLDLGQYLAVDERNAGNRQKRWRNMGYEGWHVGRVEYGQRDEDATELRLIGDLAEQHIVKALSASDTVTRLDIAVTWRATPPDPHLGANAYSLAEAWHREHPRSALPARHSDADGGYTLNLGKRESAYYLRLYNKHAECIATRDTPGAERYAGCWRYELECKGGSTAQLAELVANAPDRAAYVQRYLYQYCEAHGFAPAFGEDGGRVLLPGFRRRSDTDSNLAHLARNVRPTLDRLRADGYWDRVREVLGLP